MIELTEQQQQALDAQAEPPRVLDPRTSIAYVLVRADVYQRMQALYDDSPWTDEEMDALAWEAGLAGGWNDMDDYDTYGEPR